MNVEDMSRAADFEETAWLPPGKVRRPNQSWRFLERDLSEHALRLPPEPTFTKADVAAAGQDAFAAGHAAGLAEAADARATAEAATLAALVDALRDAASEAGRVADQAAAALASTILEAMQAVMPDLVERSALAETGAMLAKLLPGLSREPEVQVIVPEVLASGIEAKLKTLPEPHAGITVIGSSSLNPGEARVTWSAGHALRKPHRIWDAIMNALEPALHDLKTKDTADVE